MASFFKILMSSTHMTYHFHRTIPPLIRVAVLAPKLNWRKSLGGRSLEILRNAFGTHYRFLTTPQRWEVTEARKWWIFKRHQGSCFLIVFLLKWQGFFKDLDEQYTHDLSLPVHHNPPLIRVAVLAPKLNWRKSPGGRSLDILRKSFRPHYKLLRKSFLLHKKAPHNSSEVRGDRG